MRLHVSQSVPVFCVLLCKCVAVFQGKLEPLSAMTYVTLMASSVKAATLVVKSLLTFTVLSALIRYALESDGNSNGLYTIFAICTILESKSVKVQHSSSYNVRVCLQQLVILP